MVFVSHHSMVLGYISSNTLLPSLDKQSCTCSVRAGLIARAGGLNLPPEGLHGWPKPNHMEREERDWAIPAFLIVSLVITILVYAVRMRARYAIAKNAGLDDILISLATLPLVGLTISTILGRNCECLARELLTL